MLKGRGFYETDTELRCSILGGYGRGYRVGPCNAHGGGSAMTVALRWKAILELAAQAVVFLVGMRIADRYIVPNLGPKAPTA